MTEPAQAPRQGEGAPSAWLVLSDHVAEAIRHLRVGERIIVLTWLDRARRDELLEALDRTPIVDIKPVLDPRIEQ